MDDVRSLLTYPTANMDVQNFFQQLPNFYETEKNYRVQPKSSHRLLRRKTTEPTVTVGQFQQIHQQVQAGISINLMQLLNLAVGCLEPDEMYCEVGTCEGSSVIAALFGHADAIAYAVSDISDTDSLEQFVENVQCFDLEEQIIFCHQDFESFFWELREVKADTRLGVFYIQELSDYRSILMALLLVQPFLTNQAIILINSANQATLQQAIWDFLAIHPQCQVVSNFDQILGSDIQVLCWNAESKLNYSAETFQNQQSQPVIQAIKNLHVLEPEVNLSQIYNAAIHAHEQQQYELAAQNYKKLLQYQPNHAEVWYRLSVLYYEVENYQDSIQAILKSLDIDDSVAARHYHLGLCLERIGKLTEAINAYQTTIKIDHNFISAYQNLGNILQQQGSLTEAETIYKIAI